MAAVGRALGGDRSGGRSDLLACWEGTTDAEHAQRCVLAHYLADLEERLEDLASIGIPDAAGLAHSLRLNLGDGYLRQGRLEAARAQLDAALSTQHVLADDGYGHTVRRGVEALRSKLEAPATAPR